MHIKQLSWPLLTAALLLTFSCTQELIENVEEDSSSDVEVSEESNYDQGVAVVKFSEEMASLIGDQLSAGSTVTKSSAINEIFQNYGVISARRVFPDDERWIERQHREGMHLWYEITFDENAVTPTKAADGFAAIEGVELAEPSPKVASHAMNDEYYSQQWHLSSDYDINVEAVWENYTKGDPDVIVCVVDGGVDPSHPDLQQAFIEGGSGGSWNFYTNSSRIVGEGHGTHVAGIIGATSNNGTGVAGIAGGDYAAGVEGVKIMSCQVFYGDYSASNARFAEAIEYGADNGALISQNSWGNTYNTEAEAAAGTLPSVTKAAIDYFIKYAGCDNDGNQLADSKMKGGLVCFSSGNDGWKYGIPASYDPVIAVGAIDADGTRAYYSNYGDWVDICAPGTDIMSTYYDSGSTYARVSGTSMACPMISGVAALVISYQGGQGFTVEDLEECLLSTATYDKVFSSGIGPFVDALGAVLHGIQDPPADLESFSASTQSNNINVTWNVPAGTSDGASSAYGATIFASTNKSSIDNLDPVDPASDVEYGSIVTSANAIGESVTGTLTVENFNTDYYVTVVPFNYGSNYSETVLAAQSVTTGGNSAPEITSSASLDNIVLSAGGSFSTTFTIVEPDGHDYTSEYTAGTFAENWVQRSTDTYMLTINASATDASGNQVDPGTYSAQISATDSYGEETVVSIVYTIKENTAPESIAEIEDVLLIYGGSSSNRSAEINLSQYFNEPDGDAMSYTIANTSSSIVHTAVTDGVLYLTAMASGSVEITVTASDPRGLYVEQTFKVVVRSGEDAVILYPNPCQDYLYVSTLDEDDTYIRINSSTGTTVYEATVKASAFDPAYIDMSSLAPGRYSVYVSFSGTEDTQTVVKI